MYNAMFQIEPLFCHWIRKNIENYKDCVVMSPDEVGVKRVIMIADDLDVDYAVINSRRKNRKSHTFGKRHSRLNHQHLSNNWQIVEVDEDDISQLEDEGQDDDSDVIENVDEIVQNLPSEQGLVLCVKFIGPIISGNHYSP